MKPLRGHKTRVRRQVDPTRTIQAKAHTRLRKEQRLVRGKTR